MKDNDDSAKDIVEMMKAYANFRKEKFEQKLAVHGLMNISVLFEHG
jgi:hypothetical protein